MMKVLHILSSPAAGGAEVFVKDLVTNSLKKNISPAILFISSAKELGRSEKFQEKFLTELKLHGIPFYILPNGSRRNICKGFFSTRKFIKENNPDVIHSHLLSGIIYAKISRPKTPLVFTHHSSLIEGNQFIFERLMMFCDGFIGISNVCSEKFNKHLPKGRCSKVIYNAVDEKRLIKHHVKLNKGNLEILAVGRIDKAKNYPLMIDVIHELVKLGASDLSLNIAGDGNQELKKALIGKVDKYEIDKCVSFLGNRTDISDLVSRSDLLLMTSDWEGLPITLLESQLSNLPAIATDVGGCSEVLNITKGGRLVNKGEGLLIAKEIMKLYRDRSLLLELSNNTLKYAGKFSINNCVEEHKEFYEEILK